MKYKSAGLFLVLVVSLFFIAACEQKTTSVSTTKVFIGGTQGVVAKFEPLGVSENNIYTIYDNEKFPIDVVLNNKGEYEIQPGDVAVSLLGPSQKEFSGVSSWSSKNSGKIDKISNLVANGGEETVSFGKDVKYAGTVTGIQERVWFANIDYNYETYLIIPEVCLKEDQADNRVCNVTGTKNYHVSGAPITIKKVEESTAGKGIMALKIKVSNAGNGRVTKQGQEFNTRDELTYSISDSDWECRSGGKDNEARLIKEEAEIVCKLKNSLAQKTLETKQIKLTLKYKYRSLVQEKLGIKESTK